MTLYDLMAVAEKNGVDFGSEIDWNFDADDLYAENADLNCIAKNGSLELCFKIKNEKDPAMWLNENLDTVEEVLQTFNLELDSCDKDELLIIISTFEEDFREEVIDKLNEIVPEDFFFEDNYIDKEESIWQVFLSIA